MADERAPDNTPPGTPDASSSLSGPEEFRKALAELFKSASRRLLLFSDHLPRQVYSDRTVTAALSAFARSSRYVSVQILVRDSDSLAREFNRTHDLAQRLSSRIQLRCLAPTVETPEMEFAVADGRGLVLCEDRAQWRGIAEMDNRVRARRLVETFQLEWENAAEDPALRRLFL